MFFKFLIGKEIGPLQTGLILSQVGGLLMIFMAFMVLLPSRIFTFDINANAMLIFLVLGIIRILAPIAVGKGLKVALWIVIALSVLKLIESFIATVGDTSEHLQFYWYLAMTGLIEVGVLIHLVNPEARAELSYKYVN